MTGPVDVLLQLCNRPRARDVRYDSRVRENELKGNGGKRYMVLSANGVDPGYQVTDLGAGGTVVVARVRQGPGRQYSAVQTSTDDHGGIALETERQEAIQRPLRTGRRCFERAPKLSS